jgi:hypothetical protein
MSLSRTKPSASVACKVRGSSPASIQHWFSARIGREVFQRASGQSLSEVVVRSMGDTRSPNKTPEPTLGLGLPFRMRLLRSTGPFPSRSRLVRDSQRGSSLTLGASAPIEQFTVFMGLLRDEPSGCGACGIKGSSPASVQGWSSARIGREVLACLSS